MKDEKLKKEIHRDKENGTGIREGSGAQVPEKEIHSVKSHSATLNADRYCQRSPRILEVIFTHVWKRRRRKKRVYRMGVYLVHVFFSFNLSCLFLGNSWSYFFSFRFFACLFVCLYRTYACLSCLFVCDFVFFHAFKKILCVCLSLEYLQIIVLISISSVFQFLFVSLFFQEDFFFV